MPLTDIQEKKLNEFQKKKLEGIVRKMMANGEDDANIDAMIDHFISNDMEKMRSNLAGEEPQTSLGQMVGDVATMIPRSLMSDKTIDNPLRGLPEFAGGVWKGVSEDLPAMLQQMITTNQSPFSGASNDLGVLGNIPELAKRAYWLPSDPLEEAGRFAGAVGVPALLGHAAGKGMRAVGRFAAPENTLVKANAMVRNAYGGTLEPNIPGKPSSLDYAQPYIMEESQGQPFRDLQEHTIVANTASSKFSGMMRGLEDQFRDVPIDRRTLNNLYNTVVGKIASITDGSVKNSISKWVAETFGSVTNVGDLLKKRAELNESMRTYYRKNQMSQKDAMGDPSAAADVHTVNEVRDIIDKSIDKHAGGNINTQAMYQIEAALKDVAEAGPKALERNQKLLDSRAGGRFGASGSGGTGQVTAEAGQALAGGARSPYLIGRVARTLAGPMIDEANLPDKLIATAGKLMQEGGHIRKPGKLAVQEPMQWWQNPTSPMATPAPGVRGVDPGPAGSMPPAIRQPMVGQVVNPGGAPPTRPVAPPQGMPPGGMSPLVQVGPGQWVAQDILDAGNPPREVGAGRTFQLGPYSPATASDMELNQAAINRPTPRKVGKPPQSTWRMKKDLRPVESQPQPGELDVNALRDPVETQPFNVNDRRTQFEKPEANPLAPDRMQEQPIRREDMIRQPSDVKSSGSEQLIEPNVVKMAPTKGLNADAYTINWPGTEKQGTYYAKPGEPVEPLIEKFKQQYPID